MKTDTITGILLFLFVVMIVTTMTIAGGTIQHYLAPGDILLGVLSGLIMGFVLVTLYIPLMERLIRKLL